MKNSTDKLSGFIVKMISLLELHLDKKSSKRSIRTKNSVGNSIYELCKMANLVEKFIKLNAACLMENSEMGETDEAIIKQFLAKNRCANCKK